MRLPADAALIVIDVQQAIDDPIWGPRNNFRAEMAIAALLAAWREQKLPIVHVRHGSTEPRSPYRSDAPGFAFKPEAAPLPGERVVTKTSPSAFASTDLEAALDEFGATTLVFCGAMTHNSVEASVRAASALGFRAFVVADACWSVDVVDLRGRRWPAEDVHALSLTRLHREHAQVVSLPEALAAAAGARIRERLRARQGG